MYENTKDIEEIEEIISNVNDMEKIWIEYEGSWLSFTFETKEYEAYTLSVNLWNGIVDLYDEENHETIWRKE